jgi:hypothetical protein
MEVSLRRILEDAVGEPPNPIDVEMIRRRVTRRRAIGGIGTVTAVALVTVLSLVAFDRFIGPSQSPANASSVAGAPRYYVQQGFGESPTTGAVVRATSSGSVTATVRCPARDSYIPTRDMAAANDQTFFIVCQQDSVQGEHISLAGSWIYRFQLTSAGQVENYSLVSGGNLGRVLVGSIAVTPNGSRLAVVAVASQGSTKASAIPPIIMVVNTKTGARVTWQNSSLASAELGIAGIAFAREGQELVFLAKPFCPTATSASCESDGEWRSLSSLATSGGISSSSQLLLQETVLTGADSRGATQSQIHGWAVAPNGSEITVLTIGGQALQMQATVIQASATTGKELRVLYKMPTGDGYFYRFFSSDPTGRYLLLDVGPAGGPTNGWINNGKFTSLSPSYGGDITYEVW